jgi:hypothetical protein
MQARAVSEETGEFIAFPGSDSSKKSKSERAFMVFTGATHCEMDLSQPTAKKGFIPFLRKLSRSRNIALQCHKYLVMLHADKMSQDVQCALRALVESCTNRVRLLVTANSSSSWIPALRSRFVCLRIRGPTEEQAVQILQIHAKKEKWKYNKMQCLQIVKRSKQGSQGYINLNEMLIMAEMSANAKPFRIHLSDRANALQLLTVSLRTGNREKMRGALESTSIDLPNEWTSILTGDLINQLMSLLRSDEHKRRIIHCAAEWQPRVDSETTQHPLLVAEAFFYALADILDR